MANKLKNQQGIALPAALFLVVIVTLLGFSAMSIAENQTIMVSRHQQVSRHSIMQKREYIVYGRIK